MFMQIDEVAVDIADWKAFTKTGDEEAKRRIAEKIEGIALYCHALSLSSKEYVRVPLDELEIAGIVKYVTVHTK